MTTPTSATQAAAASRFAKDPSLLHVHLAEYCEKATGQKIDPKHVQIMLGLHGEFQKSEAWKQVKIADAKERTTAAKKAVRAKRTDKLKVVTEGPQRPDDSHLQYKVWSDEPVESESGGDMVYAMLEIPALEAPEGVEFDVIERKMDAADLQVHRKGCGDVAKFRKDKLNYHVRTVRGYDPIHVAYIEVSEINQSNGEGTMGWDIDTVNILPCAHEKPAAKRTTTQANRRKSPAKKAVSMDVTDAKVAEHQASEITPDMAEAIVLETGGSKEEAEAAAIEQEYLDERAANQVAEKKLAPRRRRAVKTTK